MWWERWGDATWPSCPQGGYPDRGEYPTEGHAGSGMKHGPPSQAQATWSLNPTPKQIRRGQGEQAWAGCYSEWTMQRPVVVVGVGGGPCLQTRQEAEDLTFVYEMLKI